MSKFSQIFVCLCLSISGFSPAKSLNFSSILGKKEDKSDACKLAMEAKPKLSMEEKKGLVENLLENPQPTSIIDAESIESLEFLSVASALGEPRTLFGKKVQKDLLSCPTKDPKVLQNRSEIIRALCDDQELLKNLDDAFARVEAREDDFFSFFVEQDEIVEKTLDQIYFGKRFTGFNTSAIALEGRRLGKYIWHSFSLVPPTVFGHAAGLASLYLSWMIQNKMANNFQLSVFQRLQCRKAAELMAEHLKQFGYKEIPSKSQFLLNFPKVAIKKAYSDFIQSHNPERSDGEFLQTLGDEIHSYQEGQKAFIITWALRGLTDIWYANRLRNSKNALSYFEEISGSIHQRMHALAMLYQELLTISNYCKNNSVICENFESLDVLMQFCERSQELSNELASLTELLSTASLTSDTSFFAIRGRALAAYKLMEKTKDLWLPALQVAGELEAYLKVAQNLCNGKLCFAQAIECREPYIEAHNCRNPLVVNDEGQTLILGYGTDTRDLIVTGPHGCGKSVAQKGLAYSVLSAMTFNVAFADEFIYTPFDKVFVFCNVKEDIDANLSTFMAECARIEKIEKGILDLEEGAFALVLPDEAFKGTMEEEGAKRYYAFCNLVSSFDNTLLFGITHFEKLTELENDSEGKIINYHVELLEPREGEFKRTFKLVRGKPDWWFDDANKRGRFINWLRNAL